VIFRLLLTVPPDPPLIRVPLREKCGSVYQVRNGPVTVFQAVGLQPVSLSRLKTARTFEDGYDGSRSDEI
jgi:hypothetical protein